MHKKHIFLNIFSKITIFACVFCAFPAWSDTTCNTNFTPIMGNSWQNGTPTPTNPVDIISVGDKTKNLASGKYYKISVTSSKAHNPIEISGDVWITDGARRGVAKIIEVEEGKKYTVSMKDTSILSSKIYAQYASLEDMTSHNNCLSTSNTIVSGAKYALIGFWGYPTPEAGQTVKMEEFQIEEGSTATSYVPYGYRIPGTSIYLDEPLRKVGEYADELRPDGTVIRRVGVKVLDGTEDWSKNGSLYQYGLTNYQQSTKIGLTTHFQVVNGTTSDGAYFGIRFTVVDSSQKWATVENFKSYLAQQYAAGTPVTAYYPLATEVLKSWSCGPIADIKIATTKMVEDEFAVAEANLAATVQTIESVVSRTISQTEQIQVLQDTKQTRPDETCPANMKCLLVQDEDGTPHWYPIIEP